MLAHLREILSLLFRCARAVALLFLVLLSDAVCFPPAARAVRLWEEWFCRLEDRVQLADSHGASPLRPMCLLHLSAAKSAAFPAATHALQSHLSTATSTTSPSAHNRSSPAAAVSAHNRSSPTAAVSAYSRSSPAAAALRSCRPTANYPPPRGAKAWWYQPWLAHSAVTGARRLFPAARGAGGPGGAGAGGRRYVGTVPPAAGGRGVGVTRCEGGGAMYTWPDPTRPRVCVLGGGFGGLYAALRLDSLLWSDERRPQVLLVDQSERFVFKPLLYELLSQDVTVWEIAPKFTDVLRSTQVAFLQDGVQAVHVTNGGAASAADVAGDTGGRVRLASGVEVEYDWLVLALGAQTNMAFAPGAKGRALPFSTLDDALAVDRRLLLLEKRWQAAKEAGEDPPPIRVVVVGAGYAGVELACTVGERLGSKGRIEIIDPAPAVCPAAAPGNRRAAERALKERGVHVRLGNKADVEESLRVKGLTRVFALGDAACVPDGNGRPLPATAQVAFQQADYVGWNIWAAINNRPLLPFRYQHLGELVLLGSKDAAASVGFIDDFLIEGRAAHTARKLAYLYRLPTNEHRARVGVSWLTRAIVDGISEAQNLLAGATKGQGDKK
ncbi:unnamed protein product [Closterium sp. Yama58-4]|nr:unnamed protein product [Closterium sp. Yama58-4]